jgi:hypothetical protein
MVFSVIQNVFTFVRGKKDIDIFKKVNEFQFQRCSKYFIENSKKFYNDIENGYYTLHDLAIFLLYKEMIGEKMSAKNKLYLINQKSVTEVMKLFTNKRLKEDLKLIKEIHKELNFKKGLKDYFEFMEDGTNIAYVLTKNGKISPIFFIRNFQKTLTESNENVIIYKNNEYKQFEKIAIKIKETLTGGSRDEQAEIQD